MADVGTGATLTFVTTSWSMNITAINGTDISRAVVPTSHLGTTGGMTFIPGDLYDPGGLDVDVQIDTEDWATANTRRFTIFNSTTGLTETIRVTLPVLGATDTTGALVSGSGFVSNVSWNTPLEELVTGTMTIKFSGNLTWTNAT